MHIDIIMKPQGPVLDAYHRSRSRVTFIRGPLGSGKTFQTIQKILVLMCEQEPNAEGIRPTKFVAVRNTYPDLETTTIADWLELWGPLGKFTNGTPPIHKLDFELDDGTRVQSEMIFMALDRPDAIKKLRGVQCTGFWLNETKELNKAVVDMADLRHGRYPSLAAGGVKPSWHGMVGDTNAPDEDHWWYKLAEETPTPGWEFFHQPGGLFKKGEDYVINPDAENINNLPEGYYVNGQVGKSPDWIDVNLCNEYGFVSDGKPVHPRYVDSVHCIDMEWQPSLKQHIVLGFDFGRTPAAAFMQPTASGGWVVFDEFVCDDMSALTFAPELAKYLRANYPGFKFKGWGDPSGNNKGQATDKTPFMVMRAAGIPCNPTQTNDPMVRRSAVEAPLREVDMVGKPRLIILPKAKTIRKGLAGGFCYKRVLVAGDERYHDEPAKNEYSHPVEALEYGLQGEGEGQQVIVGQLDNRNIKAKRSIRPRRRANG